MKHTDRHRSVAEIRGFIALNRRTAKAHTYCETRPPSGGGPCGLRNAAPPAPKPLSRLEQLRQKRGAK